MIRDKFQNAVEIITKNENFENPARKKKAGGQAIPARGEGKLI